MENIIAYVLKYNGILKCAIKIQIESNTTTKRIINPFWADILVKPPYVNNKLVS